VGWGYWEVRFELRGGACSGGKGLADVDGLSLLALDLDPSTTRFPMLTALRSADGTLNFDSIPFFYFFVHLASNEMNYQIFCHDFSLYFLLK
jgi:hypothetical protein